MTERSIECRGHRESAIDEERFAGDTALPEPTAVSAATAARLVIDLQLSRRERAVARGLLRGDTQKAIAAAIGLSEPTVSRTRQALRLRLAALLEADR